MKTKRKGTGRKSEFVPVLADAFIELGYQRTTTAELARRCGVRENELYRIWPSKKAMFLDAIRHIFTWTLSAWSKATTDDTDGDKTPAERLIAHQARDHGHRRFYRIVFSGLTEVNDQEVRLELKTLYERFHQTVTEYVVSDRTDRSTRYALDDRQTAWAIMGIGAIVDIQRELGLLPKTERGELLEAVALAVLNHT